MGLRGRSCIRPRLTGFLSMMQKTKTLGMLAACVLLAARPVSAQIAAPREPAPLTFGPVSLHPTLQILDAGIDENVFNDGSDPQRDYTLTVATRSPRGASHGIERAAVSSRQRLRVVSAVRLRAIEQCAVRDALQPVGEPVQAVHRRRAHPHDARAARPRSTHARGASIATSSAGWDSM